MGERGITGTNTAEEVDELDLLEELQDDELQPFDDMLQQSRVVVKPSAPPPARTSAPPPIPPDVLRRSSVPPPLTSSLPPPRSGIFAIDADSARPEPTDGSVDAELRARALHVDRLRLNVRLRDDRIRELERALQQQSRREQELERRAEQERARADALQAELDALRAEREGDSAHRELQAQRARADDLELQLKALRAEHEADDLKRIQGVGPSFERSLRKLGVTSFAQIAAWTPEDVLRIANELNVSPRRIERDGWIERARELSAK